MGFFKKIITYFKNREFNKNLQLFLQEKGITSNKSKKKWRFFFPEEVHIRPIPSSDFSVFLQVFYHQQYQQIINLVKLNSLEIKSILDLGANVGYTSIYFHRELEKSQIFAIEPDIQNFIQLRKNTERFENIQALNLGVWGHETQLVSSNVEAEDWGKSFKENTIGNQGIKAVTISQLIQELKLNTIDILKMDIEGAEDEIFKEDVSFLNQTKVIAIEIHDDKTNRNMINEILKSRGFLIWDYGELTIGINQKIIS